MSIRKLRGVMNNSIKFHGVSIPTGKRIFGPAIALALLAALAWAYWSTIVLLFKDWQNDENYSVGQLVPLVALYLLWRERAKLRKCRISPCWWAIGLILIALAMKTYGLLFLYESAERYSLVLMIAGVVLLVTGREVFRKVAWILLFLVLMVPLPGRVHNMISGPLQAQATRGAVFLLDLFGMTVAREGNTIILNNTTPLAVAEACSGLRMLTAFIVVSATLAYLIKRPRWQKITLLISSIPVAIGCNIVRLYITALLYAFTSSKTAETFFHDFAGLAMMPLAVLILIGEIWLMNKLVIPESAPARSKVGTKGKPVRKSPRTHHKNRKRR